MKTGKNIDNFCSPKWNAIFNMACSLMEMGLEPTSAFQEAAHKKGVEYGSEEMEEIVNWANEKF